MLRRTSYPIFFALALLFTALAGFQSSVSAQCQIASCCPAPRPVVYTPCRIECPAPKPVVYTCPVECPAPKPVVYTCPVACPAPKPVIVTRCFTSCLPACSVESSKEEAAPVMDVEIERKVIDIEPEPLPEPAPIVPEPQPEPVLPSLPRPRREKS